MVGYTHTHTHTTKVHLTSLYGWQEREGGCIWIGLGIRCAWKIWNQICLWNVIDFGKVLAEMIFPKLLFTFLQHRKYFCEAHLKFDTYHVKKDCANKTEQKSSLQLNRCPVSHCYDIFSQMYISNVYMDLALDALQLVCYRADYSLNPISNSIYLMFLYYVRKLKRIANIIYKYH